MSRRPGPAVGRRASCLLFAAVLAAGCPGPEATPPADATPAPPAGADLALVPLPPAHPAAGRLGTLQAAARDGPADATSWVALGRGFVDLARGEGDPGYYLQVESAASGALAAVPDHPGGLVLRAVAALQGHRFEDARAAARRAVQAAPGDPAAWGALCDAAAEIGADAEAREACRRMVDLRPDAPSTARAGWLRWLDGDPRGAERLLARAAVLASPGSDEAFAWTQAVLAEVHRMGGAPDLSLAAADAALARSPRHRPSLSARARALHALARDEEAEAALRAALAVSPYPEDAFLLADLLAAGGSPDEAGTQRTLAARVGRVVDPRGLSLALSTRGLEPDEALALARAEARGRDDVVTADVLAWALFRAGRFDEAADASARALRLGTADPRFLYHAGMIRLSRGDGPGGGRQLRDALAIRGGLLAVEREEARAALARAFPR